MSSARQLALADRLRGYARHGAYEVIANDLVDAASSIELSPPPPASDGNRERNRLISRYLKTYHHQATGEAAIKTFLDDVRKFERVEYNKYSDEFRKPDSLDDRRWLLCRILQTGTKLPMTVAGIKYALRSTLC